MEGIFESKTAGPGDVEERLAMLSRAITAFDDCWVPRLEGLQYLMAQDLAAFDAGRPNSAGLAQRPFIEAYYGAMIEQVMREGKRHLRSLERLEQFFNGEDTDWEEETRH